MKKLASALMSVAILSSGLWVDTKLSFAGQDTFSGCTSDLYHGPYTASQAADLLLLVKRYENLLFPRNCIN